MLVKYSKHKHPANMIAALPVERSKTVLPDGAIVEIVVWNVLEPGSPTCSSIDCFMARTAGVSSVSTTNAAKAIHRNMGL